MTKKLSPAELAVIRKIADRAVALYDAHNISVQWFNVVIDIGTCHARVQKLRLSDLLMADDFNFIHDVAGINRHLDRDAKKLTDCFSPRFSAKEAS
jgi:hypothetical protein